MIRRLLAGARTWAWQRYAGAPRPIPSEGHAAAAALAGEIASRYPHVFVRQPCAICSGTSLRVAHAGHKPLGVRLYRGAPRLPLRAGARFPLIYEACSDCGAARINPTLRDSWIDFVGAGGAADAAHWMEDPAYVDDKQRSIAWHHERLGLARFRGPGNSVLDVSCGSGVGLEVLRTRFGWVDCRGVECDGDAAQAAIEKRSLAVMRGLVHQVPLPAAHFDLAILDNALEHHADPRLALRSVRRAVRTGGAVMIIVPNLHGHAVEMLGTAYCNLNWGHWHYFTVQSLRRLLGEQSLRLDRAYCDGVEPVVLQRRNGASPADAHVDLDAAALEDLPCHERRFRGDYITLLAVAV